MTTEELLLDLDEQASLETAFGGLDGLRELFVQQAARVLALVRAFPTQVKERWAQLCVAVGAGRTEQVHRLRPRFEKFVWTRIEFLRQAQRLTRMTAALGHELSAAEGLLGLLAELEQFAMRVLGGWNTPDDLEELAAADYPLSDASLGSLCKKFPPPQSWYDEENQP